MDWQKSAGHIDWITVTVPDDPVNGPDVGLGIVAAWTAAKESTKDERRPWAWLGFHGWVQGGVRWGHRPGLALAMVSGAAADHYCHLVATEGAHVSRLDVCADVSFARDTPGLAGSMALAAAAARESGALQAKTRIALIDGFGSGDTFYLGSRKSGLFLRVYDKYRESGDEAYKWVWRFELEVKDARAALILAEIRKAEDWGRACRDVVANYLRAHGLGTFQHMGYWGTLTTGVRACTIDYGEGVVLAEDPGFADSEETDG